VVEQQATLIGDQQTVLQQQQVVISDLGTRVRKLEAGEQEV
jgi:hypothetical protein